MNYAIKCCKPLRNATKCPGRIVPLFFLGAFVSPPLIILIILTRGIVLPVEVSGIAAVTDLLYPSVSLEEEESERVVCAEGSAVKSCHYRG